MARLWHAPGVTVTFMGLHEGWAMLRPWRADYGHNVTRLEADFSSVRLDAAPGGSGYVARLRKPGGEIVAEAPTLNEMAAALDRAGIPRAGAETGRP